MGLGSTIGLYQWYLSSPGEVVALYTDEIPGPALVIAPHNDDEVLGTGGVIQRHLRQGDRVSIVLLTNGDGQYRGPFRHRAQAIQFGYKRQQETLNALKLLGVAPQNVYFLGYPDRGLGQLWDKYWSCQRLYTSSQTGMNHSPYSNSYTPKAPYCGLAVVQDLEAILEREKPSVVYLPHPNDSHPDHWSAHAFTVYALEKLKLEHPEEESYSRVRLFSYLVHYGRWPMPRGIFLTADLKLPRPLANMDTRWWGIPLVPEQISKKYQAILQYRSQVQYMLLYMASFARRNELFGEVPTLHLAKEDHALSYPDPKQSTFLGGLRGYNDIKAVHLATMPDGSLVIEVELFEALRSSNSVLIHLKTLGGEKFAPSQWRFVSSNHKLYLNGERVMDGEFTHQVRRNLFRLRFPLEELGNPQAFLIGAELMRKDATFSKTAYRLVELVPVAISVTQ